LSDENKDKMPGLGVSFGNIVLVYQRDDLRMRLKIELEGKNCHLPKM